MSFLDLGWTVLDRNLITDAKPGKSIKSQTSADLVIDISWLKFSDPEMFCKLDRNRTTIGDMSGSGSLKEAYMVFNPRKEYDRWRVDHDRKHIKNYTGSFQTEVNYNSYRNKILSYMMAVDRFNTNKNVVSAVFKLINAADGSLLGYYHIGEASEIEIPGGTPVTAYDQKYYTGKKDPQGRQIWTKFMEVSSFYKRMNQNMKDKILLSAISYMDIFLPNEAIPFAAQLNEMEDVKLTDDKIIESWSSSSTTRNTYSDDSRHNYRGYFNSRYYKGSRDSHYSGEGYSTTHSYGGGTTTYKEAEYIRYSDFFGYYKPLTEKFIEEIQKIQNK